MNNFNPPGHIYWIKFPEHSDHGLKVLKYIFLKINNFLITEKNPFKICVQYRRGKIVQGPWYSSACSFITPIFASYGHLSSHNILLSYKDTSHIGLRADSTPVWSCWPESNRLSDVSPAKMGLFWINREFGVCNHCGPHASLPMAREGERFYRGEKEVGRAIINKESMAFHWLSPCRKEEESFFFQLSSVILALTEHVSSPFWSPNSV